MTLFHTIFGFEAPPAARPKPAPDLPWDDPLWQFTPASPASEAICQKIENAALVKELLGELPTPAPTIPELELFTAPAPTPVLAKTAKPQGNWTSTKHRSAIQALVDKFRNSAAMKPFKSHPEADSMFATLVQHGVDYVCAAVHQEAAEEGV